MKIKRLQQARESIPSQNSKDVSVFLVSHISNLLGNKMNAGEKRNYQVVRRLRGKLGSGDAHHK